MGVLIKGLGVGFSFFRDFLGLYVEFFSNCFLRVEEIGVVIY